MILGKGACLSFDVHDFIQTSRTVHAKPHMLLTRHARLTRHSRFLLDQISPFPRRSRVCGSGGANVPELNALLAPFGISFGTEVFSGTYSLANSVTDHLAGSSIRTFPTGGLLHRASLTAGIIRGADWVGGDGAAREVAVMGFYRLGALQARGGRYVYHGIRNPGLVSSKPFARNTTSSMPYMNRRQRPRPRRTLGVSDQRRSSEAPRASSAEGSQQRESRTGSALPIRADVPKGPKPLVSYALGGTDTSMPYADEADERVNAHVATDDASDDATITRQPGWINVWGDSSCLDDSTAPRAPLRRSCVSTLTSLLVEVIQPLREDGNQRSRSSSIISKDFSWAAPIDGNRQPAVSASGDSAPPFASISSPLDALDRLYASRGPGWRPRTLLHSTPLSAPFVDSSSTYSARVSPKQHAASRRQSRALASGLGECHLSNASCNLPLVWPPVWVAATVESPAEAASFVTSPGPAGGAWRTSMPTSHTLQLYELIVSIIAFLALVSLAQLLARSRRRRRRARASNMLP